MEMKRKDVIETCRGVAQSCLLLDGKAVAKDDAGKRHEVDIRSLAVGVGVGSPTPMPCFPAGSTPAAKTARRRPGTSSKLRL